jgi:hypothetical protein
MARRADDMAREELHTSPSIGQTGLADGRMLRLPPATTWKPPFCRRLPQGGVFTYGRPYWIDAVRPSLYGYYEGDLRKFSSQAVIVPAFELSPSLLCKKTHQRRRRPNETLIVATTFCLTHADCCQRLL